MSIDTSSLERTCVMFSCTRPAVDPDSGLVHCATHQPADATPPPAPPVAPPEARTGEPAPAAPDMASLEPHWDGHQWVLRPRRDTATLRCPHCAAELEVELR